MMHQSHRRSNESSSPPSAMRYLGFQRVSSFSLSYRLILASTPFFVIYDSLISLGLQLGVNCKSL